MFFLLAQKEPKRANGLNQWRAFIAHHTGLVKDLHAEGEAGFTPPAPVQIL